MRWLIPWTLAALLVSQGCGPSMEYTPGHHARTFKARASGVYELYEQGRHAPVYDAILLKGDRVGFRRELTGELVAFAAGQRWPLPEKPYRWEFEGFQGRTQSPGSGDGLSVGDLVNAFLEAAIAGTIEGGLKAADREIAEQGLTKYQKDKLERARWDDP